MGNCSVCNCIDKICDFVGEHAKRLGKEWQDKEVVTGWTRYSDRGGSYLAQVPLYIQTLKKFRKSW